MHGALHWWNRLKWLAGVNALLASRQEDNVERLVQAAEASGAGRAAARVLLLCRKLFQTPLPASLLNAMTTGQGEHDPHDARQPLDFSSQPLSRSWRYQLAELGINLTNPTDVLTLPLPQPLLFLYLVLRLPLCAWRHSIHRGRSPN
jgi:hypothetical protein